MNEHFCTYFDHRYAPKGLAMWQSLKARHPSAVLHVLCLNEACHEILAPLSLMDVHLHPLSALEGADPGLLRARGNRSLVEYYFTLTPCLPLHIFRMHPETSRVTYVDADLFFIADPQPVLDEIGDHAIGVIEHRFPENLAESERYGRFNVGWLTFRNDPIAAACLSEWREECIEWCYDRVEPGRFAEQKYLDDWPDRFRSLRVVQHKGANVGPWNLNRFELTIRGAELMVGGEPILFFHAHGFQPRSPGRPRVLNLEQYRVNETPLLRRVIFDPYESALTKAAETIAVPLALTVIADHPRVADSLQAQLSSTQAQLSSTQAQLAVSENDRDARLDVIHSLQGELADLAATRAGEQQMIGVLRDQLGASEADRAARLDAIHALQRELAEVNADRAARLDAIHDLQRELAQRHADAAAQLEWTHTLQSQLSASEADRAARLEVIHQLRRELNESQADRVAKLESIQALRAQLETTSRHLADARAQATAAHSRIVALESSRSWRWTRPFRWVARLTRDPKKRP